MDNDCGQSSSETGKSQETELILYNLSQYLDSIIKNVATDKNLSGGDVDYTSCTTDTKDITDDGISDVDPPDYQDGFSFIIKNMTKHLYNIAKDDAFNQNLRKHAGKHNASTHNMVRVEDTYRVIGRNIDQQQNYMMDDQDDTLVEKIIYRKLNAKRMIDEIVFSIGCKATIQLALIAWFRGARVDAETRNITVECAGVRHQGSTPLIKLVDLKIITFDATNSKQNRQYSLSEICGAIPEVLMLYIRTRRLLSCSVDKIFLSLTNTTLPVELRYIHAGSLPLSRKLRIAHLDFAAEYYKNVLKETFNPSMYTILVQQSKEYKNHHQCLTVLDELDKNHELAFLGRPTRTFETTAKRYSQK